MVQLLLEKELLLQNLPAGLIFHMLKAEQCTGLSGLLDLMTISAFQMKKHSLGPFLPTNLRLNRRKRLKALVKFSSMEKTFLTKYDRPGLAPHHHKLRFIR